MTDESKNPFEDIQAAFMEAVEMQLRENDPPETRLTLNRLISEGMNEKDAKKLIANTIEAESIWIIANKETFNYERFTKRLGKLSNGRK